MFELIEREYDEYKKLSSELKIIYDSKYNSNANDSRYSSIYKVGSVIVTAKVRIVRRLNILFETTTESKNIKYKNQVKIYTFVRCILGVYN